MRFAPLPPKTIFAFGTSVVFEEVPVTTKAAAAVSASLTLNASAPVDVFALTVWSPITEIVGAVFVAVAETAMVNVPV